MIKRETIMASRMPYCRQDSFVLAGGIRWFLPFRKLIGPDMHGAVLYSVSISIGRAYHAYLASLGGTLTSSLAPIFMLAQRNVFDRRLLLVTPVIAFIGVITLRRPRHHHVASAQIFLRYQPPQCPPRMAAIIGWR